MEYFLIIFKVDCVFEDVDFAALGRVEVLKLKLMVFVFFHDVTNFWFVVLDNVGWQLLNGVKQLSLYLEDGFLVGKCLFVEWFHEELWDDMEVVLVLLK